MIRTALAAVFWLFISISPGCTTAPTENRVSGRFDLDKDGYLTPEEFAASKLSKVLSFETLDTDEDGLLSAQELGLSVRGSRGAGGRQAGDGARRGRDEKGPI